MTDFLSVADQLTVLLRERTHPSGRPYTLQEVSDGTGIAATTLSQLRTGRIKNPQLSSLRSLCAFFNVPLRYFETRSVEACYAILQAEDDSETQTGEITEIAFRARRLSREAQQDILTIIKWVQNAEQAYQNGSAELPPLPRLSRSDEQDDGAGS